MTREFLSSSQVTRPAGGVQAREKLPARGGQAREKYCPQGVKGRENRQIRDGRDTLNTALDALKTATDARNAARWNQLRARLNAVAVWDSNFGELMSRFPGDRVRVESYFPNVSATAPATEEEPTTEPTGTGTTTPTT